MRLFVVAHSYQWSVHAPLRSLLIMALLVRQAHTFLKQLLGSSCVKEEDTIITKWDDALAEVQPHEGHVLLCGSYGAQKLLHCITYEMVDLPGHCLVFEVLVLWMVLFHLCDV